MHIPQPTVATATLYDDLPMEAVERYGAGVGRVKKIVTQIRSPTVSVS